MEGQVVWGMGHTLIQALTTSTTMQGESMHVKGQHFFIVFWLGCFLDNKHVG
jgi:hypothetical protein